jgi:hypothetical protein
LFDVVRLARLKRIKGDANTRFLLLIDKPARKGKNAIPKVSFDQRVYIPIIVDYASYYV